jgi:hypothetical protein
MNLVLGLSVGCLAVLRHRPNGVSGLPLAGLRWVLSPIAVLLGLALLDAASAFARHGPPMRAATMLILASAAGDVVAAVLLFLAGSLGKASRRT